MTSFCQPGAQRHLACLSEVKALCRRFLCMLLEFCSMKSDRAAVIDFVERYLLCHQFEIGDQRLVVEGIRGESERC
jgi:hypothetical protein